MKKLLTLIIISYFLTGCSYLKFIFNDNFNQCILIDEFNNEIICDYIYVSIKAEYNTKEEAERLSSLINGINPYEEIKELNMWKIYINADSILTLENFIKILQKEKTVNYALIDSYTQHEDN